MPAAVPLIAIGATIATTAYATHEQQKMQDEQDAAMQAASKKAEPPKLPDTQALAASTQQADIEARTAGGTILGKPGSNQLGDGGTTGRKTLLGQ